jgi:integrase
MAPRSRPGKQRKQRVPKLAFAQIRGIGWHVSYRDANSGLPRKHRFGLKERSDENRALALYYAWVAKHLGTETALPTKDQPAKTPRPAGPKPLSGSLLDVGGSLIDAEQLRIRREGEPRRRGTIDPRVFSDRRKQIQDFLGFMNSRHGQGAVSTMRLGDLTMDDVEAYNRHVVEAGYSASQVVKRMHIVRAIIDRAGRPEHGLQMLTWNWDSRDSTHGKPATERLLPTKKQLQKLLAATDLRGRTWIWLGIGLGFGARDLAVIRVGQITEDAYDLRRAKTGVERYGETPPLVWALVSKYQKSERRQPGELLFRTRTGEPLVHGPSNAVTQWWTSLRESVHETGKTLFGFYTLRHLGATEFGSRPGTSIGDVKRWLGHAASSNVADLYMRPVRPEYREVVEWVRKQLRPLRLRGGSRRKKPPAPRLRIRA